jgi:hypothetical protein
VLEHSTRPLWPASCSELPHVVIHVEVGMPHPLSPRQLTYHCMRGEFALTATELVKQPAKLLDIRCKFHGTGTTLLLIHFRARLDAVWPLKRYP